MIDINRLLDEPQLFRAQLTKRGKSIEVVDEIININAEYKSKLKELESLRAEKNRFSDIIASLSPEEKKIKLEEMKIIADQTKILDTEVSTLKSDLDTKIKKIPNILSDLTPVGKDDNDNPVVQVFGTQPKFDFVPRPYRELDIYKKFVGQEDGTNAMGSRGYYMRGDMARFQKVLFDYALDTILAEGYEMFYAPLMLNDKVLTGTGHLPDFDGQQYEVPIDDGKSYYLIGSSEPSIMGYFMNKNLGDLSKPILATCRSSCFRKEAGSYGKDQQGILRVHQFEKIEMVVICRPEDCEMCYANHIAINEKITNGLGIHFRKVEVCSGDMPGKHHRQQDYEARFPAVNKFREIGSNGNASDFQNRGLGITYNNADGKRVVPRGLNDTGITFRTGLAIIEQNQMSDGRIRIPDVLVSRFGKEYMG